MKAIRLEVTEEPRDSRTEVCQSTDKLIFLVVTRVQAQVSIARVVYPTLYAFDTEASSQNVAFLHYTQELYFISISTLASAR